MWLGGGGIAALVSLLLSPVLCWPGAIAGALAASAGFMVAWRAWRRLLAAAAGRPCLVEPIPEERRMWG